MRLFADYTLIYRPIHTAEDHIILQNDLLLKDGLPCGTCSSILPNVTFCQWKEMGQVSTLLHTMWPSTIIGNQQSLPWCHPHWWFAFLYPCEEDLCQRKSYAGFFLKSKFKKISHKSSENLHTLACADPYSNMHHQSGILISSLILTILNAYNVKEPDLCWGTFVSDQALQACYDTWNGNLWPREELKQD